jgi:hypothetical protein
MNSSNEYLQRVNIITVLLVIILAAVSLGVAVFQMLSVGSRLSVPKPLDLKPAFTFKLETPKDAENLQNQFDSGSVLNHWMALATMEGYALENRHNQANLLLLTRVWLRLLAIVAGLILCVSGSLFILGKLKEPSTTASASQGTSGLSVSVATASPGLFFALLGTTLIIVAIISSPPIDLKDSRAFLGNQNEVIPGVSQ